jgi:ubiquinone/menaquinone biosynthesis C-methylase UbiE
VIRQTGTAHTRSIAPGAGAGGRIVVGHRLRKGEPVPDDDAPSAAVFDGVFTQIADAPRVNELFGQVLGPFPAGVEPFSLVPRQGLDRVLAELRLGPGGHLLDLCCGRGGIGLWFASASGARLTGVDFSAAAIGEASRRAAAFTPPPRASFLVADAVDTGLPAGTVDAVVCIDSLQFVPGKAGVLREIARVLRPGGRVVVTTWERRGTGPADLPAVYSIADAAALAQAAGLRVLVREERDDWQDLERAFYRRVIAEDSDQAEPALRLLAGEGRALLPHSASVCRLLLVASA